MSRSQMCGANIAELRVKDDLEATQGRIIAARSLVEGRPQLSVVVRPDKPLRQATERLVGAHVERDAVSVAVLEAAFQLDLQGSA